MEKINSQIRAYNDKHAKRHQQKLEAAINLLELDSSTLHSVLKAIADFQVAIPSWALGTGGTRFGRFPIGGEPRNLEEKIEDVALLHQLTSSTDSISLHIPWDIPKNAKETKAQLAAY